MPRTLPILLSVSLVLLLGCSFTKTTYTSSKKEYRPAIVVPLHIEDVCKPDRGEEQDVIKQSKGKAFDRIESSCI